MQTVAWNSNVKIPQIGLGTFGLKEESIQEAIQIGYRLLDTAWQYGNEVEVGNAVKHSGIARSSFFITTKLWTDDIRVGHVKEELEQSLKHLQMEYVDLYLIHWPAAGFERAWVVMEQLQKQGKVREIGVSNFAEHHFAELKQMSDCVPILNQVECHPYFQNRQIIDYCQRNGIITQAWCPLGGSYSKMVEKEVFQTIADKYGKTPAQVILRWHLQRGVYIIPRSSNRERLKSNFSLLDFELAEQDMEIINGLDTGKRMGADPDNFAF